MIIVRLVVNIIAGLAMSLFFAFAILWYFTLAAFENLFFSETPVMRYIGEDL